MEGRGPEALLLAARLAEHRAVHTYRDLEMPGESSMYVEVCVRAALDGAARQANASARPRAWARLAAALRRATGSTPRGAARKGEPEEGRGRPERPREVDQAVRSISAAPIGRVEPVRVAPELDGPALALAFQPLARLGPDRLERD
jgi:hypothetical protein